MGRSGSVSLMRSLSRCGPGLPSPRGSTSRLTLVVDGRPQFFADCWPEASIPCLAGLGGEEKLAPTVFSVWEFAD